MINLGTLNTPTIAPGSPRVGSLYFNAGILYIYDGSTYTVINSAGSNSAVQTIEVNLGGQRKAGSFTISSSGLTAGRQVLISQATGPYTNKGTLADEAEKDLLTACGYVVNSTTIKVYWKSATWVHGNFKFNYSIQ